MRFSLIIGDFQVSELWNHTWMIFFLLQTLTLQTLLIANVGKIMQLFVPSTYSTPHHSENLLSLSLGYWYSHTHTHTFLSTGLYSQEFSSVSWSILPQPVSQGNNLKEWGEGNTRELFQKPYAPCKWIFPREHYPSGNFHLPPHSHSSIPLLIRISTFQPAPPGSSQQKATAIPVDLVKFSDHLTNPGCSRSSSWVKGD